jgi:hypothetical protein
MGQSGTSGVRAVGLSPRFKHAARLLLLLGVLLMVTGLFAESAGASNLGATSRQEPRLSSHRATFQIPVNNPVHREWVLSLWNIMGTKQRLLGKDSGTAGKLIVKVPATPGCDFQVDVFMRGKFYSGFRRQLADCGKTAATTTTTTKPVTTTTSKPKTTGSTGGTTGTTGGSTGTTTSTKSGGGSATTQPVTTASGGQLAFTGAGVGMWLTAALGALLILIGGLMLLYASRYTRAA